MRCGGGVGGPALWPRLPCLMFFEDVRQCFAPRPERIGSWKLAQELQEMEEWGAGCPTPAEPEEHSNP